MKDFNTLMANNIVKDSPPTYRQSCLVLTCTHCLQKQTADHSPSILLFESEIKRLDEGIACPTCTSKCLPDRCFTEMVQKLMYGPFNIYSKDATINFESQNNSVTIPLELHTSEWTLPETATHDLFEWFLDIGEERYPAFEAGLKHFDFKNWSFRILSQNCNTIHAEDFIDFVME